LFSLIAIMDKMDSTFYVTIEHLKHSSQCSRHCSGVSMESASSEPAVETLRRYCPAQTLATCWEFLLALFSATITSAYTLHHEMRVRIPFSALLGFANEIAQSNSPKESELQVQALDPGHFSVILDPSPALMLVFCLVLGCSVSSFCYRRQEQDKFQAPIFVLVITAATIFGFGLGINANLIMLGLIPWALCFSMGFSAIVHWLVRRCSKRRSYCVYEVDGKEVLLRH
jgi:hypothetical protein